MKRAAQPTTICLLWVTLCSITMLPASAEAETTACFRISGTEAGAAGRTQHVVGLTSVVRLTESCRYAASPQGPWHAPGDMASRETDFLGLLHYLRDRPDTSEDESSDPRFLFAIPAGRASDAGDSAATETPHTLILRYCVHYLLEEQIGFRVVPYGSEEGLRIERITGSAERCDSDHIELRAVSGADAPQLLARPGDPMHTMEVGGSSLTLPHGEWSIFAARRGGRVALRIGVFRARRAVTPLQHHLRTVGLGSDNGVNDDRRPLLATRWRPGENGMLLVPTPHALEREILWPELRTAADAGFLWLARRGLRNTDAPVVMGNVVLEAGEPAAVRFPDRPVAEYMRERYGLPGEAMTPTLDDWEHIFSDLAVCLTPNYYSGTLARTGAAAPDAGSCAAFASLVALEQGGGGGGDAPRICLQRGMQVMGADEARWEALEGDPLCVRFPSRGQPMPFHVVTVGDRITLDHGDGLCLLIDNRPLEAVDGEYVIDRSGLLEVRQGGGEGCTARQALTRLRLPVLDPEREWHPVGLHSRRNGDGACRDEDGDETGACPWRALAHDEQDIFAYVRPRHSLEFRLSTSPAIAAAMNSDPEAQVQMSQDVPLLSGVEGDFEGAASPGIVAFVSDDATCPTGEEESVEELRRRRPLEPDGLIVDRIFHVFLASVEDPERPPRCLARATFRIRHSRDLVNAHAGNWLGFELGLLGDTQLAFFATSPLAFGVALPVFYLRLSLFPVRRYRFLALEIAGNLMIAMSLDTADVSRAGASLSAAIQLGIPRYVPRLLSVGIMLHGAAETHPTDNPIFSVYISLDLSTLVDLAGGR